MRTPSFQVLAPASSLASKAASASSKKSGNTIEVLLAKALKKLNLRPSRKPPTLPGRPDFVFSKPKVVVFCDGDYWHGRHWPERRAKLAKGHNAEYWLAKIESNLRRDRRVGRELRALGYSVVRLWESEIRKDPEAAARRVEKALTKAKNGRKNSVMSRRHLESCSPAVISLFSGAGGLDLGFEAAGFETRVAVEFDKDAVATLRANRPWPVFDCDIHQVSSEQLLERAGLRVGEADILIGGPPCQPFSKAGFWSSGETLRLDDKRAGTLGAYLRILRDTLPKCLLIENVPGIAYRGKSEGLDLVKETIAQINRDRGVQYSVRVAQLNAADYGVPQTRERLFVVGSREGRPFEFPAPTHYDPSGGLPVLGGDPYLTAWDAIGDLENDTEDSLEVQGKWSDLLPSIPEGQNYLWHTDRGNGLPLFGWRRRFWTFLLKLDKNRPSWTIQAQPGPAVGPFHWKNRRLSARELCRLQTFPEGFQITGNLSSAQKQLGNAVPSALAEVLARAIRKQLLGQEISPDAGLIPARRLPRPSAEPVGAVPDKYLFLAGDHKAHPGTGQGYAAIRRVVEVGAPIKGRATR